MASLGYAQLASKNAARSSTRGLTVAVVAAPGVVAATGTCSVVGVALSAVGVFIVGGFLAAVIVSEVSYEPTSPSPPPPPPPSAPPTAPPPPPPTSPSPRSPQPSPPDPPTTPQPKAPPPLAHLDWKCVVQGYACNNTHFVYADHSIQECALLSHTQDATSRFSHVDHGTSLECRSCDDSSGDHGWYAEPNATTYGYAPCPPSLPPHSPPPPSAPPPTSAVCIDGYWPLLDTESASNALSPSGESHTHVFGSTTWWMPDGFLGAQHDPSLGCPAHATLLSPSPPPPSPPGVAAP